MNDTIVRIESIEIKNFKNVGYGHLDFGNSKKATKQVSLGCMDRMVPAKRR